MSEIIYTDEVLAKLDGAVQEAADSLTRVEGETQFRKDVSDRIKEEIGMKPADFNKLVKERFDEGLADKVAALEEIMDLHEKLMDNRRKRKTTTTMPTSPVEE